MKSPFVTTSDVLDRLNKQLSADFSSQQSSPDGNDDENHNNSSSSTSKEGTPHFELQKRIPNGSSIPATKEEVAAADFKSKLEQS